MNFWWYMQKIKISIITACLNSERCIEKCINSVLLQTYSNIEYIVVDGQSTDATCKIIGQHRHAIAEFISERDTGIYSAWNKGIKKATGDYVFILNSDDTLQNSRVVEDVVGFILKNHGPKAVYGKVLVCEEGTDYSFVAGRPSELKDFVYKMSFCTPGAFINRSVYHEVGFYDEQYSISSDYDWAIRLFKMYDIKEIVFFDRIITVFCTGGVSNKRYRLAFSEVSSIVKKHFSRNSYFKHLLYIRLILLLKKMIPYARKCGLLEVWRKVKTKRLL